MGRERQKRKNRSSVSKVKHKDPGRTKSGKRKVNFLGNAIIAQNWDKSLTLSQNYRRLGLTSKLNAPTGGLEKKSSVTTNPTPDPLAIVSNSKRQRETLQPELAKVERDPNTGAILHVLHAQDSVSESASSEDDETSAAHQIRLSRRPLNDVYDRGLPLKESRYQPYADTTHGVVPALEAEVSREAQAISKHRRPRQQSAQEKEWIARLVEKHGDNVTAMTRDRRLNPMQQSEGDVKRRVEKFLKQSKEEEIAAG